MTLNRKSLREFEESARVSLTDEQRAIILDRFGEEPWPYMWSEQDISEQIDKILNGFVKEPIIYAKQFSGKISNASKRNWKPVRYTLVKAPIDPDVVSAFKDACSYTGVSMEKALTSFMREYSDLNKHIGQKIMPQGKSKPVSYAQPDVLSTRRLRRKLVNNLIDLLEKVKLAEEGYRDRIPENLRYSDRYEDADQSVEVLLEAIDILSDAY